MPAGAIYVGRPTLWGNPFREGQTHMMVPHPSEVSAVKRDIEGGGSTTVFMVDGQVGIPFMPIPGGKLTLQRAIELYRGHILETVGEAAIRRQLKGRHLVCWCRLDRPCHADVLLEIANGARLTAALRSALVWLRNRNGDGVFGRGGVLLAGGCWAPIMRRTWNDLTELGLVELYAAGKRLRVTAAGAALDLSGVTESDDGGREAETWGGS